MSESIFAYVCWTMPAVFQRAVRSWDLMKTTTGPAIELVGFRLTDKLQ